ncbi:MAG: flagellar hook-associated protein FlgK [Lachnospiraceae bacterium]|nr:flagellar hook-associated protein FlgK [Lachnospiraceae bacterium]
MASTFMGLNISYTGLVASNAGLNATANNISNIETKGFSRQEVKQTAAEAMRCFQNYGCIGAGVDTLGVERIRDLFYDEKYWANNSRLGESDKKQYYCAIIENYLRDQRGTDEVKGFTTMFSEYWSKISSLAANTSEDNFALDFIGAGANLCEYFNILYNNFQKMQKDVNDEIKIDIDQINSYAQQIATLNKQINTIEIGGNTIANELRDKRDLVIDQLSALIDVECEETEVFDAHGNSIGAHKYVVKICGGQALVNDYNYRQLECIPRTTWQKVNQNDADGLYDVVWTDTKEELGVTGKRSGGQLKGLFEVRDGNNYEAFSGKVTAVSNLEKTVRIKVSDDYLQNMSKSTIPLADGRIKIGGEYYYYTDYDFELDETGACYYTFHMSEDKSRNPTMPTPDAINQSVRIGDKINYQGIPYYLEQMNEWVRDYAYTFNTIYNVEGATDYYGNVSNESIFYTGTDPKDNSQYAMDVQVGATSYNSLSQTGYYTLTAGNFNVSKELENDPKKLHTHTGETEGESKYDIIESLIDLSTNTDKMKFRGCSAESFLICMLGDSGLNAQSANSFQNIYDSIRETIENNRYSISGVDKDEEAANMIKYQSAYSLASKMISVLNECYDRLISGTGV